MPPVTSADLLGATLRHRADRVLVGEVRGPGEYERRQPVASGSVLSTESVLHNVRDRCRSIPSHSAVEQPPRQQSEQNEQNRDGEQPDAQRSVIAGAQSLQSLVSAAIPSRGADWAESSRQNPSSQG